MTTPLRAGSSIQRLVEQRLANEATSASGSSDGEVVDAVTAADANAGVVAADADANTVAADADANAVAAATS